jgi:hypothetical protein
MILFGVLHLHVFDSAFSLYDFFLFCEPSIYYSFYIAKIEMAVKPRKSRKSRKTRKQRGGNQKYIFIKMFNNEQGLGNQLYIYAAAVYVQKKINLPICIVFNQGEAHTKNNYRTLFDGVLANDLNIPPERVEAAKNVLDNVQSFSQKWFNKNVSYNIRTNIGNDFKIQGKTMLLQSYIPVNSVFRDIKYMLIRNEFNKDIYKKYTITNPERVAFMHVRRGDFANLGWSQTAEYFSSALQKLEGSHIEVIHVFSNDVKWCKEQSQEWQKNTTKRMVYDETSNELEVLYMMMLCTGGAILSGSTFGSWGAYLGPDMNPESIIVYKKFLAQEGSKENPYQYPDRWIAL